MNISLIVAMDHDRKIGNKGKLPWDHIPVDMKRFRNLTIGGDPTRMNVVIMGRRTWESLPVRPLRGRINVVLSGNKDFKAHGAVVLNSIAEVFLYVSELDPMFYGEVFVIGGAKLYELFLPRANRIYLTYISGKFEGDTLFPFFDTSKWDVVSQTPIAKGEGTPYDLEFFIEDRIKMDNSS